MTTCVIIMIQNNESSLTKNFIIENFVFNFFLFFSIFGEITLGKFLFCVLFYDNEKIGGSWSGKYMNRLRSGN